MAFRLPKGYGFVIVECLRALCLYAGYEVTKGYEFFILIKYKCKYE